MANKADPRKLGFLLLLLAALVIVAIVRVRPALIANSAGGAAGVARVGSYKVPSLGWERDVGRQLPTPRTGRSLFAFGPPPTPTPDRRPTPIPPPTPIPRLPEPTPIPTPAPWGDLPPPPRFAMTYIGWLGPDRLPIAVFLDGEDVLAVPVGEKVKERFVLRQVGPTGVTIGFVGYPGSVTTEVQLAR